MFGYAILKKMGLAPGSFEKKRLKTRTRARDCPRFVFKKLRPSKIMISHRPLGLPIILAIVMIALLVVLTVGWVILNVSGALHSEHSGLYWALLTIGSLFIVLLLAGTILYLILSIKAINLTHRQSNFIDSVTHELKSPMASMKLYLQTLSRHQVSMAEQSDFYRFMLEDLERLNRLINQMLEAGRLEALRSPDEIEDVNLPRLLSDCAASVCLSYRVPAETIRLSLEPCSAAPGPSTWRSCSET